MSEDSGIVIWIILIAVFWAIWNYDIAPLSDEISVLIQKKECDEQKKCRWDNYREINYKINTDTHEVVYWYSDKKWPLHIHDECIVLDRKHWSCKFGETKIGFDDGDFSADFGEEYRFVSKTQWWKNKL